MFERVFYQYAIQLKYIIKIMEKYIDCRLKIYFLFACSDSDIWVLSAQTEHAWEIELIPKFLLLSFCTFLLTM